MILGVTGHRPHKLKWGYDLYEPRYVEIGKQVREYIIDHGITEVNSGMAKGFDTIVALVVLKLKKNYGIKLNAIIPCMDQDKQWHIDDQKRYKHILSNADNVIYVSREQYRPWLMQTRNKYIVDHSDIMLALWNGSVGGTGNCVTYAEKCNKQVHVINPMKIIESAVVTV